MYTLAKFQMDHILPLIGLGKPRVALQTPQGHYVVKASSNRLECLKRNQCCVRCGIKGREWFLEVSVNRPPRVPVNCFVDKCPWCALKHKSLKENQETPHLNLYAFRKGRKILMTQDHIFPKHAGGSDRIENLQTMCTQCNAYKGGMLPHEYAEIMTPNERAIYLGRMAGGSSPSGGLPSVHAPASDQASATDCAAE